jgi:hypothetical protein
MSRGIPAFAEQQPRTETTQAMRAILCEAEFFMGGCFIETRRDCVVDFILKTDAV